MKKVFKNNRIIVGLCSVLLAAGVCIGTNHYMISDSAGSVAAESQKADPLTRLAAAAEQDFDILEEEQESDNSPGWHTETQGSKTYKYYNNSAGNRLKGYRKIKMTIISLAKRAVMLYVMAGNMCVSKAKNISCILIRKAVGLIQPKSSAVKHVIRSESACGIIWLRSTQKMVQRGSSFRSKQWFVRWA